MGLNWSQSNKLVTPMSASIDVICNLIDSNLRNEVMKKQLCLLAIVLFSYFKTNRSPILEFSSSELAYLTKEDFRLEYFEFKIQQVFGLKSNLLIPAD